MNYDQHVAASFQAGFEQRLQHLVVKSAMVKSALDPRALWRMASQAQRAGASLGRVGNVPSAISPKFKMPDVMSTNPNILQRFGKGTTSDVGAARMTGLARGSAGKPFVDPLSAPGRFAPGSALSQAARAGQLVTGAPASVYSSPVTGRALPKTPGATRRPVKPNAGFAKVNEPLPTPPGGAPPPPVTPPPPGAAAAPPPNAAPGTITPEAARQMGLVTTNRGFGGGPKPTIDVDATVTSGDPTGGLLGRIRNMLPGGARAWAERNPELYGGALGALGGGGAVMAGDQYGDWRRRRAIENLGLLDRLGLALQLAASPRGFNQTLGL